MSADDKQKARLIAALAKGPRGRLVQVDLPLMHVLHEAGLPSSIVAGYRDNHHGVWLSIEGDMTHLWIRRHDNQTSISWGTKQAIKNELCGEDRVGVEVFPRTVDLVDQAPMFHIWVYPKGHIMPFSLKQKETQ